MERHDDIRDQLADYVLGELSTAARHRVQEHLDGCPECAAHAQELSAAFHGVGLAEEPVRLPAHLKARVLASLQRESRVPGSARALPVVHTRRPRGVHPGWLAAAAAGLVVLGGMLAVSQQRAGRLVEQLRHEVESTARLTTEAGIVADQADLAVAILTSTDMRRIDLEGFDVSRNATARAYWSATKGLLIVADRLPPPPSGRTYQVWLIGGGNQGPVSAGLIDARPGGRGMLIVPPPGEVTGGNVTVAVTDEPVGGLPAPTGAKHLVGSL